MVISIAVMESNGATVDTMRGVDHDIPPGVYTDMREHGATTDEWLPNPEYR